MKYREILKEIGVSYIGNTTHSAKLIHSYEHKWETYGIYLAPADLSGYNTCPNSKYCKHLCLNGSGHNKVSRLSSKGLSKIDKCRIAKTKYLFENKEKFIDAVIHEIKMHKKKADDAKNNFAIRINCTSDIDITSLKKGDKNLLELFPDIQFYDYTKVVKYLDYTKKYSNFDLTLSYTGHSWNTCEKYLNKGGKVAMVFEKIPKTYKGFNVINADKYDMRFLDPKGTIMGLTYKAVDTDYINGKFQYPKDNFIIDKNNNDCIY